MKRPALDIRHLEMIEVLAETPRITDAAEKLRVTPSALSHRIKEMERRLGVPLFIRIHKRLRPSPAAEYLGQVAKRLLGELARAEEDVCRMAQGVQHVVRLSVEAYSSYHWLPGFLKHLQTVMPDVGVQVVAAAARNAMNCLNDRSVDLILVSGERARSGAELVHLFDDELMFIMPPDHALAGRDFIEGPDIVGENFITYTRLPEPDREYALLFRPNNTFPNWTETVELPEAIVEMVAAGLGTSILAGWAVRKQLNNGRVKGCRVSAEGIRVPWYAAVRAGDGVDDRVNLEVAEVLADWCGGSADFAAFKPL